MKKNLGIIAGLVMGFAVPAQAKDCGQPPVDIPAVPAGETASADDIKQARDMVLAFSGEVDKFITCMERRSSLIAPYMTKEQVARRQEDLNELHNGRRDLQIQLNEAIRAYRRQTRSS